MTKKTLEIIPRVRENTKSIFESTFIECIKVDGTEFSLNGVCMRHDRDIEWMMAVINDDVYISSLTFKDDKGDCGKTYFVRKDEEKQLLKFKNTEDGCWLRLEGNFSLDNGSIEFTSSSYIARYRGDVKLSMSGVHAGDMKLVGVTLAGTASCDESS